LCAAVGRFRDLSIESPAFVPGVRLFGNASVGPACEARREIVSLLRGRKFSVPSKSASKHCLWMRGPVALATVSLSFAAAGSIEVTSPNGSERLLVGETHTITWTAPVSITQVKIEYSSNGGTTWGTFKSSTPNDGNEPWTVPNIPSAFCIVRVADAADGSQSDESDGVFRVEPAGSWPFIVTKTSGEVIVSFVGGDSAADSEIGFGYATTTTPASNRHILFQDVPDYPSPTSEQSLGFLPAGSGLDFYVISLGVSAYSGNRPNESFSDLNNDHGWGDTAVTILPNEVEGYLLHLDRATGGIDDDNDFLIEVKVVPVGESPPVAVVQTPSGVQSGDVRISYTLKDTQGDACMILVQLSDDGGLTWRPATTGPGGDGVTNLTSSRTGQNHVFVWDSLKDIGETDQDDIRIRITPSDTEVGTPGETSNFRVDNVPPPELSTSPDSLEFEATEMGPDPLPSMLNVWNSGGGELDWQVVDNAPWLTLKPSSGQSTGEQDTVNVSVSVAGMSAGNYYATITVSCTQLPDQRIYVPVTLTVIEAVPILSVNPAVLNFSAWEGGANPDPQNLEIQNIGGHTMAWQVEATMPWLRLAPESGSSQGEVDVVEVSVDIAGLTIGDYASHIKVTAASNAPRFIPVLLNITEPPPLLSVSPSAIIFNAAEGDDNVLPKPIVIQNVGTGAFSWEVSDDAPWLSVSPIAGSNSGEADTVLAGVNIAGLAPGTYPATITVTATAENSPQEVEVTLMIAERPPTLSVSPGVLNFSAVEGGENPLPQKLTVKNAGSGDMDWQASGDMAWVVLSPQTGTSAGEEDEIQVSIDIADLTAGSYAGRITLTSSNAVNSPVEIPVLLEVSEAPPRLAVSPTELIFLATEKRENPPPQEIEIQNAGSGELSWQVSTDSPWLSLFPTSGTLTDGSDKVQVQVTITDLPPDTYTATITVTGTADNSPQTVSVTLVVKELPSAILEVTPLSLDFLAEKGEANPPPQGIRIQNVGGREMAWHVFSDPDWLTASPNAGSSQREEDVVEVSVDISSVPPGVHSGTLTVTAPGAEETPQTVQVTLTVEGEPPVLEISPLSLSFQMEEGGADPAPQTFRIQNTGGGEMVWQVSADEEWVLVSPKSGANIGSPELVEVSIGSDGMTPGNYTTMVTVEAPGAENSPQTVSIKFTITERPPVLVVSPSALSFQMEEGGASPSPKTFAIRNAGGREMQWQASAEESWVHLTPVSGTNVGTSQFVQVSISSVGLAPGNHDATVTVEAPDAENSPQTVNIGLLIKVVKPELHVSPEVLEFTTRRGGGNPASQTFTVVAISPSGITWVATENASWLSLNPTTDTNQGEEDVVVASVNKAGLDLGTYEADIIVRDAQRPTFRASVHVILRVEPIRVLKDYTTIQDGIDAAEAGDVILVPAGTYRERIRMKSGIEVIGGGADTTIIDGDQQGTAVAFEEVNWAKLEGFTITRGTGEHFGKGAAVGGGVYISQSSPLISKCRIVNNSAVWGGGICLDAGSSPLLIDCEISGNSAVIGAGIFCYDESSATITATTIWGNRAEWYGGGLCLTGTSSITLGSCEISRNSASYDGAGISGTAGSHVSLVNCTIVDNDAPEGAAMLMEAMSEVEAANSIIWGNTSPMVLLGSHVFRYCDLEETDLAGNNANISSDPVFVEPAKGDYHLLPSSPCIDMGWNEAKGLPATDLEGEERIMAGLLGEITDMGADELNPAVPLVLLDSVAPEPSGMVSVSYRLYHLLSTPCSVLVEYSKDAGNNWRRATRAAEGEGILGLLSSPTGETHTFVWDSVADEGGVQIENVLLRITPQAEVPGTARVGKPFSLDNAEADSDNDKLPDLWEQTIADANLDDHILSPRDVLGNDDFDGDGNSNRTEYLVGTDPVDDHSYLRVLCTRELDGETVVSWPSVKGKIYRILYSDGLENGWRVLSEPMPGTGDWIQYLDVTAGEAVLRFYKVEAE